MTSKILLLFFLLISISGISQDLIIKKDSTKILCNILQVDSLIIHYQTYKDGKSNFDVIDRKDVLKFYLANVEKLTDPKQIKVIGEKSKTVKSEKVEKEKKGHSLDFGFVGGIAKPTGAFSNVSVNNLLDGNAQLGSILGISAIYRFIPVLGFKVVFHQQKNDYNNEIEFRESAYKYQDIRYASEPWRQNSFLFGTNLSIPIFGSKRYFIELNGLTGFSFVKSYGLDIRFRQQEWNNSFIVNSIHEPSKDFSNVFNFGLGFKFKITENFSICPEADYWMSKFQTNVKVIQNIEETGANPITYSNSLKQLRTNKIRTFNFKIGLFYTFSKKENTKISQ